MAFLFRCSCFGPSAEDLVDDYEDKQTASFDDTASYATSSVVSRFSLLRRSMWTPALDPETQHTYYWHRLTKQTTWTKPPLQPERYRSYGADTNMTDTDYDTDMSTVDGDSFRPLHRFTMGLMSLKEVSRDEEDDLDYTRERREQSFCAGRFDVSTDNDTTDGTFTTTNSLVDASTINDDTTAFQSSIAHAGHESSFDTLDSIVTPYPYKSAASFDPTFEDEDDPAYSPSLWEPERKPKKSEKKFYLI